MSKEEPYMGVSMYLSYKVRTWLTSTVKKKKSAGTKISPFERYIYTGINRFDETIRRILDSKLD